MGAAERHETNQEARAKNRARTKQRQKNRGIDAELRRVAMSNAPPLTREEAASAVAKKIKAKEDKAELRRVPRSNAPPLTREGAASAVEKAATAKRNKAEERRSAQYAVCQQRKDSRLTKHSPSEED